MVWRCFNLISLIPFTCLSNLGIPSWQWRSPREGWFRCGVLSIHISTCSDELKHHLVMTPFSCIDEDVHSFSTIMHAQYTRNMEELSGAVNRCDLDFIARGATPCLWLHFQNRLTTQPRWVCCQHWRTSPTGIVKYSLFVVVLHRQQ